MKKLAIVIPVYKSTYLEQTIESISAQTSKEFTLYIGDDCSPYDIKSIVNKYVGRIDLHYTCFDTNLGGKDLVAQWERCIDLTQGEPWIWLFGDDDLMLPNCVETVLKAIDSNTDENLYRFDVNVIDSNNNILRKVNFSSKLSCEDFYKNHINGKICSFVVEFIFNRKHFLAKGRFQNFDLAWGTDVATWLKLSREKGILTLPEGNVLWRASGENITTIENKYIIERKLKSSISVYSYYSKFWGGKYHYRNLFALIRVLWGFRRHLPLKKILTEISSYSAENILDIFILKIGIFLGPRIIYK